MSFVVSEHGHVVQLLAPQSLAAAGTTDTITMKNHAHLSAILNFGAGSGCTITAGECTSAAGSDRTAISFRFAQEATANGDVLDAALAWGSAITIAAGTAAFAVIEIEGDELADGYPWVQFNISDPGAAKLASAIAIMSGGRYQEDITATAIA